MSRKRMFKVDSKTNPVDGVVVWSPVKSIWYTSFVFVTIAAGWWTFSLDALVVCGALTAITLCTGHSVGLHRLLIHRSFECPRWVEYSLVYLGTLVGMGGPTKMLYMHDIRDWSQRTPRCHPFFRHASSIWKDWLWNLHCEIRLEHPPEFRPESRVVNSAFYRFLDRYWMRAQLPLAVLLIAAGGLPWLVWGIAVRVALSLTGHWLVGFLAHNVGHQPYHVEGASVQGYNVHGLGLITMGGSVAQQPSRVSRVGSTWSRTGAVGRRVVARLWAQVLRFGMEYKHAAENRRILSQ